MGVVEALAPGMSLTVATLFTDVVGSTAMRVRHGDVVANAVQERHDELVEVVALEYGGRVVKSTGDGTLLAFAGAAAALHAACEIQRRLAVDRGVATGPALHVRVGVSVGDVTVTGMEDLLGLSVVRAARLCDLAADDQVLVDDAVVEAAGGAAVDAVTEAVPVDLKGFHDATAVRAAMWSVGAPSEVAVRRPTGSLPTPPTSFIGRHRELAELERVLAGSRLVTLLASGGAGKTRLAIEAARRVAGRFPDGAWFVDLVPVEDPRAVATSVLRRLGADDAATDSLTTLVAHLRDRSALVVLDNAEHVVDGVAEVVARVVEECPSVHVLVTSRQRLELAAEQVWPVPVLADSGEQLFAERAAAAGAAGVRADDPAVVELVAELDGLPLAIELAAARARTAPPAELLARLRDGRLTLRTGARDLHERQRSLEALVDWSLELLDDELTAAAELLSGFAGPFDLELADAVLDDEPWWALEALADRSLLATEDTPTGLRWRFLPTVRGRIRSRASVAVAQRSLHLVAAALTDRLTRVDFDELLEPRRAATVRRLDVDRDAVREAVLGLLGTAEGHDTAVELAIAAAPWWRVGGHVRELMAVVAAIDAAAPVTDPGHRASLAIMRTLGTRLSVSDAILIAAFVERPRAEPRLAKLLVLRNNPVHLPLGVDLQPLLTDLEAERDRAAVGSTSRILWDLRVADCCTGLRRPAPPGTADAIALARRRGVLLLQVLRTEVFAGDKVDVRIDPNGAEEAAALAAGREPDTEFNWLHNRSLMCLQWGRHEEAEVLLRRLRQIDADAQLGNDFDTDFRLVAHRYVPLLARDEPAAALRLAEGLADDGTLDYGGARRWMLAACHARLGDLDAALAAIRPVVTGGLMIDMSVRGVAYGTTAVVLSLLGVHERAVAWARASHLVVPGIEGGVEAAATAALGASTVAGIAPVRLGDPLATITEMRRDLIAAGAELDPHDDLPDA